MQQPAIAVARREPRPFCVAGRKTDLDVFLGNYRHTPFGVHMDAASNFSMVLHGRKKFLLWPEALLRGRWDTFRSVDLDPIRDQALVLEANAGDVVYWPSSYWHIAESSGELSAVLNLALYIADASREFVEAVVAPRCPAPVPPVEPSTLPWDPRFSQGNRLPPAIETALAACSRPRATPAQLRRAVVRAWLSRTSAGNFHDSFPPLATPEPIDAETVVCVDPEFPIASLVDGDQLLCAAHGHLLELPALPCLGTLIERLNTATGIPVRELIELGFADTWRGRSVVHIDAEDVLHLLRRLSAMRAIRCV